MLDMRQKCLIMIYMLVNPIKSTQWFTIAALAVVTIATALDWYWLWGLLFIYWAIWSLSSGEVFLVASIYRARNPFLFWMITSMWAGFGVWTVFSDLVWRVS